MNLKFINQLISKSKASDLSESEKQLIDELLYHKVILITGAGGSVGSELADAIVSYSPRSILLFDISEYLLYQVDRKLRKRLELDNINCEIIPILGSVSDSELVSHIIENYKVNILYHTASYKHVSLVEKNIIAAVKNNVIGTYNVVTVARKSNLEHLVLISSDKAVNAVSVMGKTKRLSELIFQAASRENAGSTKYTVIRFGNLFGSSGSVVPLFMEQIKEKVAVTVTHREMTRYFMKIKEAIELTLLSTIYSSNNHVVIFDMGPPVKILDLAKAMIKSYGYTVKNEINPSGEILINFTGIKEGEKLHEELSIEKVLVQTKHPKIKMVDEPYLKWEQLQHLLKEIENVCHAKHLNSLKKLLEG